jgi:2-polyprenyl-3-methyl-5-hydroxy-6-metoxy-1,4-benzoquinol methylase
MIDQNEAVKFVHSRSWYQTIDFGDGLISKGCDWCGEMAWDVMKKFLPPSMEGMRVLDLGCNAGLFCVKSALLGAKEAIGIDWSGWRPKWDFEEQREFVKNYFEGKSGKKLPITYISGKMEEVLQTQNLGEFDYVFAIASIYYSALPGETVQAISKIAKNVILRLRDDNRIALFTGLFKQYGYKQVEVIREKCWEKLGGETDDFYMYLYSR